jgi:hypothetical protein
VAELEENVGEGRNCAKKNYGTKHTRKSLIFTTLNNILNKKEIQKN